MAGSVNKVILVGNLGKDPEIRRTQDGRPIANLRIATSESWRDKSTGEQAREDRVALGRHLQREPLQDRRAVPEEGRQGVHRGPAADPQVAGPGRPGPLLDRGRAAGLQRQPDDARRPLPAACPKAASPTTAAATAATRTPRALRRVVAAAAPPRAPATSTSSSTTRSLSKPRVTSFTATRFPVYPSTTCPGVRSGTFFVGRAQRLTLSNGAGHGRRHGRRCPRSFAAQRLRAGGE